MSRLPYISPSRTPTTCSCSCSSYSSRTCSTCRSSLLSRSTLLTSSPSCSCSFSSSVCSTCRSVPVSAHNNPHKTLGSLLSPSRTERRAHNSTRAEVDSDISQTQALSPARRTTHRHTPHQQTEAHQHTEGQESPSPSKRSSHSHHRHRRRTRRSKSSASSHTLGGMDSIAEGACVDGATVRNNATDNHKNSATHTNDSDNNNNSSLHNNSTDNNGGASKRSHSSNRSASVSGRLQRTSLTPGFLKNPELVSEVTRTNLFPITTKALPISQNKLEYSQEFGAPTPGGRENFRVRDQHTKYYDAMFRLAALKMLK